MSFLPLNTQTNKLNAAAQYILDNQAGTKAYKKRDTTLGLGIAIIEYITTTFVNKMSAGEIKLMSDDDKKLDNQELKKYLIKNNFLLVKRKLERILSLYGKAALCFLKVDKDDYRLIPVHAAEYTNDKALFYQYDPKIDYNKDLNSENELYTIEYLKGKDGKWKSKFTQKGLEKSTWRTYKEKPFFIFLNNEIKTPDLASVAYLIKEMDYYGDQVGKENAFNKTMLLNNTMFNSQKDSSVIQLQIEADTERVFDYNSPDAKFGPALTPFTQATTNLEKTFITINVLEDKIYKFANVNRDTTSTGANKHSQEINQLNQSAREYTQAKKEIREYAYARFFESVLINLNQNIEMYTLKVELELPNIEQQQQEPVENNQTRANQNQSGAN